MPRKRDMADPTVEVRAIGGREVRMTLPHHAEDLVQGRIFSERRFYERDLLEHTRTLLAPGDLVVDAGAYIGNHSLFWAGVVGARVLAFEPNRESFAMLEANLALNDSGGLVTPHSFALGARESRAALRVPDFHNRGNTIVEPAPEGPVVVRPLDALEVPTPVRLMKIDVQGMELDVLQGAESTIRRDMPYLYVEATTGAELGALLVLLASWGYVARGQFGGTPTIFFVSRENEAYGVGAQVAMSTHLLQTTLTGSRGRIRDKLDGLALEQAAIAQAIEALGARSSRMFEPVEHRLEAIAGRLDALGADTANQAVVTSLAALGERQAALGGQLRALVEQVEGLGADDSGQRLTDAVGALEERLHALETNVRAGLEPVTNGLREVHDALADDRQGIELAERLESLEQSVVERLARLGTRLRALETAEAGRPWDAIERRLDQLGRLAARVEARIQSVGQTVDGLGRPDDGTDEVTRRLAALEGQLARLGLSLDGQLLHARRVEAELVGMKRRLAGRSGSTVEAGRGPSGGLSPARVSSLALRAVQTRPALPPRSRKKLRKLVRDPVGFFADAKNPTVRALGGRLFGRHDRS